MKVCVNGERFGEYVALMRDEEYELVNHEGAKEYLRSQILGRHSLV